MPDSTQNGPEQPQRLSGNNFHKLSGNRMVFTGKIQSSPQDLDFKIRRTSSGAGSIHSMSILCISIYARLESNEPSTNDIFESF